MVTGRRPVIGISPKSAFTPAISDTGVAPNVARNAATLGNPSSRYGLPSETNATGAGPSVNLRTKSPSAPGKSILSLYTADVTDETTTTAEHALVSGRAASSAASGSAESTDNSLPSG